MNFHARTIGARSGESPFRDSSLTHDEMPRIAPVRISERCPDVGKRGSHRLAAHISRTRNVGTCRGFEHTILAHERHEGVDVVPIPGIGEVLQDLNSDLLNHNGFRAEYVFV